MTLKVTMVCPYVAEKSLERHPRRIAPYRRIINRTSGTSLAGKQQAMLIIDPSPAHLTVCAAVAGKALGTHTHTHHPQAASM
jgi:hypothetical protein